MPQHPGKPDEQGFDIVQLLQSIGDRISRASAESNVRRGFSGGMRSAGRPTSAVIHPAISGPAGRAASGVRTAGQALMRRGKRPPVDLGPELTGRMPRLDRIRMVEERLRQAQHPNPRMAAEIMVKAPGQRRELFQSPIAEKSLRALDELLSPIFGEDVGRRLMAQALDAVLSIGTEIGTDIVRRRGEEE